MQIATKSWEVDEAVRLEPEIKATISEQLTREKAIAVLRNKAGIPTVDINAIIRQVQELEDSLPEVPVSPRLFLDDVSSEEDLKKKQNKKVPCLQNVHC